MIELRYIWDCEKIDKTLEYRETFNGKPITPWKQVPIVWQIGPDDYKDPKDSAAG